MPLLALPNELLLLIADRLSTPRLARLLLASRRLSHLLTPLLHSHILAPHLYTHVNRPLLPASPPLHWACKHNHEPLVRLLLSKGLSPTSFDVSHQTPLHVAAHSGNPSICLLLLNHGAPIHVVDTHGDTPLVSATLPSPHRSIAVVQLLLDHGADPNNTAHAIGSIIHCPANGGPSALEITKLLLARGADPAAVDKYGCTALHKAVQNYLEDVVEALLEGGADANAGLWVKPIHRGWDHEGILRLLLEKGADPNVRDDCGNTVLHLAAVWGRWGAVRMLVEWGADVMIQQGRCLTALEQVDSRREDVVIRGVSEEVMRDIVGLLVERSWWRVWRVRPWLHYAARWGCEDVARMLVDGGVDVGEVCPNGHTALEWATRYGYKEIVDMLWGRIVNAS